jgi:hypothetical protein
MIKSEKHKGYTIELHYDEYAENPRTDWDHITQMICFHGRYSLGDSDHGVDEDEYGSWAEMGLDLEKDSAAILPVYMYDHSGITINTVGFHSRFDSGQIGWVRIRKKDAEEHWPDYDTERLHEILVTDVKTYDTYLRGEVLGFIVKDSEGEEVDATCWGFYSEEEAMLEAKAAIDYIWNDKHELFTQAGVEVEAPT